jgi:hypothetical protein
LSRQNKKTAKKTKRQQRTENPEKLIDPNEKKLQKWKPKNDAKIMLKVMLKLSLKN